MIPLIDKVFQESRNFFLATRFVAFSFLLGFLANNTFAQGDSSAAIKEATLSVMNRDIATFRSNLANATPELRAKRAKDRIDNLTESDLMTKTIEVLPLELGHEKGLQWYLGDVLLFALVEKDVDHEIDGNLEKLEKKTTQLLHELIDAKNRQVKLPYLIHQTILALLATLILGICVVIIKKITVWFSSSLLKRGHSFSRSLNSIHWAEYYFRFASKIVNAIGWLIIAFLVYLWLTFCFSRFPITEPLGSRLGHHITDTILWVFTSFLQSIPNLISICIIVFIARSLSDVIKIFFRRVQTGNLQFNFLHRDTVSASHRLANFFLWGLTFSIIYPLIPGSNTEAFKGLSVLFGIMISLGSTGLVSQLMSGLVVVYSRALRVGDYVVVNGQEGVVKEVGVLSTKIQTLNNTIETTIPNAVLISNPITNLTKLNETTGTLLSTQVTIGYDAPWRTVHELLISAARLIPEIKADPEPKVFQKALSDFYVEYELFVHTQNPIKKVAILSELHQKIQDNFNVAGIQIMSPHFVLQPKQAVLGETNP